MGVTGAEGGNQTGPNLKQNADPVTAGEKAAAIKTAGLPPDSMVARMLEKHDTNINQPAQSEEITKAIDPLKAAGIDIVSEKITPIAEAKPVIETKPETNLTPGNKENLGLDSMVKAEEEKVQQEKEKALTGLIELLEKDVNPNSVRLGSGDKKALILIKPSEQGYVVVTGKEVFTFPESDEIKTLINRRYLNDKVAADGNSDANEGISEGKLRVASPSKELKTIDVTLLAAPEPLIKTITESQELAEKIDAKMKVAEENKVFTQKINEYVQARKTVAPTTT